MSAHRSRRGRRFISAAITVQVAAALLFAPAPGVFAAGRPTPASTTADAATAAPFTLDLSTSGDFVGQTNFFQCVGASMQMMLNMVGPSDDRTAMTQGRLQSLARTLSGTRSDGTSRQGASVRGWSAGLNDLGAGPYRLVGDADLQTLLRMAARAIRETGRPVGLLVWAGRHAWVLAGFTATADPLLTTDFEVTGAVILDPLYPYGSKTWGPSPKPRQTLSLDELGEPFVPRRSSQTASRYFSGFGGRYVIVMPWAPVTVWTPGGILN